MIILGSLESAWWTYYWCYWTFFARCYGWGDTSEYRFKFGDFTPTGAGWSKNPGSIKGSLHANHSSSQKKRLNDVSGGVKIWTDLSSVLSQSTRLTDRQTDIQTPFSSLVRASIQCNAEQHRRLDSMADMLSELRLPSYRTLFIDCVHKFNKR